ncbi:MAG: NAD(P)-dependent oxidoreductase [Candidatus Eremiobacteraeota bacterium]|nr:NAD(P)-dependent oxidoreductase [Candidatus Eremiobacteraeota bacterium]
MNARVGFIGLGNMGKPMVRRLLGGGVTVGIYNRSRPACDELAREGALPAESPRALAAVSDVIFTMLPDAPNVAAVLRGENGVFAGAAADCVAIDSSTIAPDAARAFAADAAERGIAFLDAPVSGGPEGASAGTLAIMVGGDPDTFERVRPLFELLGATVIRCGPSGAGQVTKACNQLVVALHIEALAEAIVLARKAGVEPSAMLEILRAGLAGSRVMELRGSAMVAGDFTTRARAAFHHKDLGIALQLARTSGAVVPLTALVDQLFAALESRGEGDLDHTALLTVVERLSGLDGTGVA